MFKNRKITVLAFLVLSSILLPSITRAETVCCSSVIFIPGFEGSRLYKDEKTRLGTSTNTLWEPNVSGDIKKLYMDSSGNSLDPTIYTKDIIGTIFGVKDIYKKFIGTMDGLVKDGTINEWLPIAYDWRKGIHVISDTGGFSFEKLNDIIIKLASRSKTGKVTIIAHSNGGLIARSFANITTTSLISQAIDKMVLVAVPEMGTPEALLAMLHGYNQSIGGGLIMSENDARSFSKNMLGAYGLLPSKGFMDKNNFPVITDLFSGNILIDTYIKLHDFLYSNSFSTRNISSNLNVPILLNRTMYESSSSMHSSFEKLNFSTTTDFLSIFGWGLPTTQKLIYSPDVHCDRRKVTMCPISLSVVVDPSGDGTVLTKSSSDILKNKLFFNLEQINKDSGADINHANIMQSDELVSKLKDVIKKTDTQTVVPAYNKYFSQTEPVSTTKYLTIKIYSPVDIDVYAKDGKHTSSKKIDIRDPNFRELESNKIIGSFYRDFGGVKIMRVPFGEDYQMVLSGNDAGVFAVEAEVSQNNDVIASTTFADMPVTPLMNIDFFISTSTKNFASVSAMYMDVDGDGKSDIVNHTNNYLNATGTDIVKDIPTYLESMRIVIKSLNLTPLLEKSWLRRIDMIEKSLSHDPSRVVDRTIKKLSNDKFKNRNLTEVQKSTVLDKFNELLKNLES